MDRSGAQNVAEFNVYILKYTSISEALITAHALSSLYRVARLLDGLSEDLWRKVIRHCTKQGWKLSTQDSGTADSEYDAIILFILTEAQTNQTMVVYDSERSLRERTSTSISDTALRQGASSKASVPTPTPSPAPASTRAPSAPSTDPGIAELTKQFAQLTLLLQANLNQPRGPPTPGSNMAPRPCGDRQPRCLWCDATDHLRKFCPSFMETLKSGRIRFNDEFRLTNDDRTARHEIIDVEVDEKHKRDEHGQQGRRVRFRDDEAPTPSPRPAPYAAPIPPASAPVSAPRVDPEPNADRRPTQQKYRLAS